MLHITLDGYMDIFPLLNLEKMIEADHQSKDNVIFVIICEKHDMR